MSYDCFFCLNPGCVEQKFDKKDRPFFKCHACGAITFMMSSLSLKGPKKLLGFNINALSDQEAQRQLKELVKENAQ